MVPFIVTGVRLAVGRGLIGMVMADLYTAISGIGYLMQSAGSSQRMPLAFAGLVVIGAMAMAMYELFSYVEHHTTAWAHRGSNAS